MKTNRFVVLTTAATVALFTSSCRSTLYRAARDGDLPTVKAELAEGEDPNTKTSAAHLLWQVPTSLVTIPLDAVQIGLAFGTLGIYPILMGWESHSASSPFLTKRVIDFGKQTPTDIATTKEHADIITELILAGGNASAWAKAKAVTEAARSGNADTLQKLLQKGCLANHYCDGDYRPLMLAIGAGHEECARILLENGAQFSSTVTIQEKEITCYDYAVAMRQQELYKKLGGTIIASPASVAGKKIHFDFGAAKYRETEYCSSAGERWGNWSKSGNHVTSTLPFGKNNRAEKRRYVDDYELWSYKKTGARTATVEYEAHEEGDTYHLTFDSATSGIATSSGGYEGVETQCTGIRFTIK